MILAPRTLTATGAMRTPCPITHNPRIGVNDHLSLHVGDNGDLLGLGDEACRVAGKLCRDGYHNLAGIQNLGLDPVKLGLKGFEDPSGRSEIRIMQKNTHLSIYHVSSGPGLGGHRPVWHSAPGFGAIESSGDQ
jgi:hypothetical protein